MVDGEWKIGGLPKDGEGRFVRPPTSFRRRVTADGSSGFPAEAGRYHLYISWACPWAHRTAVLRKLKGLEDAVSLSSVGAYMGDGGWTFSDGSGAFPDPLYGLRHPREVYKRADSGYRGPVVDFGEPRDRDRFGGPRQPEHRG